MGLFIQKGNKMHNFEIALADYERNYQEEQLDFDEAEEMANEYDDIQCYLGDLAYEDMKCRC